ncbi:hypothetical protein C3F09_06150 [candidate division GN15 bacterium]|uniref:Peptide-N-glycosidase F C-terminal domain-containing protein n=1 Tax=candidate division GN15 bacterium TaxID=2072418 RepID=A0A855X773_9BACT|nr:MAG: hypothetical protein C3F09_06150 [candidate division GN15 bacterium]
MKRVISPTYLALSVLAIITVSLSGMSLAADLASSQTISVFSDNAIQFAPSDSTKFDTGSVRARQGGRVISRRVQLPKFDSPVRITGHLIIKPVPKDELEMYDRWDRAGNIRLEIPGSPDIELVKFVTAYGGRTEYNVDLSHLASLLVGEKTVKGFIDTWVTPAWKVDFSLTYSADSEAVNADWAKSMVFVESYTADTLGAKGVETVVEIPQGMSRVLLHYYVSGHCTDGTDADEFVKKDNVIYVDGNVVYRYRPWRDDCRQFRPINPYCRRWTDGSWSCDYSRSGWCPGDVVKPLELDLTDHLKPGKHTIRFVVENVRPKDANGNYGYWRISSQLLGWNKPR